MDNDGGPAQEGSRKMKRALLFLTLQITISIAWANTGTYGRLFLTPQQRAALDDARRNKVREVVPKPVKKFVDAPPKREQPSGSVTLNGIVRRSDGESTVWVNGVAMPGDAPTGKFQVAPTSSQSGVVQVPNPDRSNPVELKVGQRLDMSNGQITERYANRSAPNLSPTSPIRRHVEDGQSRKASRLTRYRHNEWEQDGEPQSGQ